MESSIVAISRSITSLTDNLQNSKEPKWNIIIFVTNLAWAVVAAGIVYSMSQSVKTAQVESSLTHLINRYYDHENNHGHPMMVADVSALKSSMASSKVYVEKSLDNLEIKVASLEEHSRNNKELHKDVAGLKVLINEMKRQQELIREEFSEHTQDGHPNRVVAIIENERREIKENEDDIKHLSDRLDLRLLEFAQRVSKLESSLDSATAKD